MTKYILEITGEDEKAVAEHLQTDLEILQTRVLKFDYKFKAAKEDIVGFIKKIFKRKNENEI